MMLCNFLKKYILVDSIMRLCFIDTIPGLLLDSYDIRNDMEVYIPMDFDSKFETSDLLDKDHWIHQFDRFSVVGISEGMMIEGFPEILIIVKQIIKEEE